MVRDAGASQRSVQLRDRLLFAAAALIPALAVGWLGLRALQGQEEATRREVALAVEAAAQRTTRESHEALAASMARLATAVLPADPVAILPALQGALPSFAQPVMISRDGELLIPPLPEVQRDTRRPYDAVRCEGFANTLLDSARASEHEQTRQALLQACHEARTPTGRWLWPLMALHPDAPAGADDVADWLERHTASMRASERDATRRAAMQLAWLQGTARTRALAALASSPTDHESVANALRESAALSAVQDGPDATGAVRWQEPESIGWLRELPGGERAGFVVHRGSLERAWRAGWPPLPPELRAALLGPTQEPAPDGVGSTAWLTPGLGVHVSLADPGELERRTSRARLVLLGVGIAAVTVAFAVAALLFARMQAAKRLSALRAGFVSTVSHELRTPIASMRMLAELLDQQRVEPEEQAEVISALARESQRLGDTVDRLLGFSRMAAGRLPIHRHQACVVRVVSDCIDTFEERNPSLPAVERAMPTELLASVDVDQLKLAVDNLLCNARKYAPAGTPYRVAVREEGNQIAIEVADRGPGIARRHRRRIFEAFERGDDRLSAAVQGSGIGLALVRQAAEAHGGRAEVHSEPGNGARFLIRFPRREP